jgi:hypothetical protein
MVEQKRPLRKGRTPSPRPGKRYFLATMDRELIKNLKLAAIEDEKSASECLEEPRNNGWTGRSRRRRRLRRGE